MIRYTILFFIFLLDLYAFQAVKVALQDLDKSMKYIIFGAYWLLSVIFLGLFLLEITHDIFEIISKSLRVYILCGFVMHILAKIFISFWLIIDDIRRLTGWLTSHIGSSSKGFDASRSDFMTKGALLFGALPFIILGYGIVANAYRYKIFRKKVKLPNLPAELRGLKIIQLSDIHSGSFWKTKPIQKAVDLINQEKPDLIFFTGDLVNEETSEVKPLIPIFRQLKAKHGVYSVLGNHDYGDYRHWPNTMAKQKNMTDMFDAHQQLGWSLLNNEHRTLEINGQNVNIIGVENYSAKDHFPKYGDLQKATQNLNKDDLCLLLSHDPTHWDSQVLTEHPYIDITFSGHTHGMQFGVEIPGFIKWSPVKYLYPRWADLYKEENQYLYVNRGFGFLGYPGRVGILPEITVMELES